MELGRTAVSDVNNGKMSSLGTYAKNAVHDGCIFAITSAIFPPLSGVKVTGALGEQVAINLSGKQMLGCVFGEGMLSNYLTQLWDKGEIDVGETIKSGLESMAFLGLLHGAGKLFEKASPFVKKAAGKIAFEISDNMKAVKIAFKNMEMPKGVKLGMNGGNVDFDAAKDFAKKFKNAKNEIKGGTKGGVNMDHRLDMEIDKFQMKNMKY